MNKTFFDLGKSIAVFGAGFDKKAFNTNVGMVSALSDHEHPHYGKFQKCVCKYAANAFREAGNMVSFEYELFKKASETPTWYPELDRFSDAVLRALGTTVKQARAERSDNIKAAIVKSAAPNPAAILPMIMRTGTKWTPDVLKNLAAFGIGGGAVAGSLSWIMNRHANEDESNIEAMDAKRRYYKTLANQIRNEIGTEPITEDRLEDIVDEQNEDLI